LVYKAQEFIPNSFFIIFIPFWQSFNLTVAMDHDHRYPIIMAVFLFHHRSNVVVRGGFPSTPVWIVVVGGGYPLPRCESIQSLWSSSYFQGEGVASSPLYHGALSCLSCQVSFLNWMGWKIESSCYWVYVIHFWTLVQST
jgi:hypothetical protein